MASKLTIISMVCVLCLSYSISAVTMPLKLLDKRNGNNGGVADNEDNSTTGGHDEDIVSMGGEDEQVGDDNITAGLYSLNVTLNTTLPNTTGKVNTYTIKNPEMTEANAKALMKIRYPDWTEYNTRSYVDDNITSWIFSHDDGNISDSIIVNSVGEMDYHSETADRKWQKVFPGNDSYSIISQETAYNISLGYIESHGYLPNGAFLFENHTSHISGQNIGTIVGSYSFGWQRRFNDAMLAGRYGMGDGILITVTPLGDVQRFFMLWREIGAVNRTVSIKSSSDAMDFVHEHLKTNQTIEKVELGYFIKRSREYQYEMKPCWIFYTNLNFNEYYAVNALKIGWCY
jgi:hypothetical protein